MMYKKNWLTLLLCGMALLTVSCEKVNVEFGDPLYAGNDPNITYLDSYPVTVATYKPDSIVSSASQHIAAGYHMDPVFGVIRASGYLQLNLPPVNTAAAETEPVIFDSLILLLKVSGNYYGDSTQPVTIRVFRLTQNIKDPTNSGDTYYNTTVFGFDPGILGNQTFIPQGKAGSYIHLRLPDALGQELLTKFRNNDDDINTTERFVDYFKGLHIASDTVATRSICYFAAPADSALVRLYYHTNGAAPVPKSLGFSYKKEKQFNNLQFRYTNPDFTAFINNKAQLIGSTVSGNRSFLNSNMGSYVKFSFPAILNLKELHPLIKVTKALLEIRPDQSSMSYPYNLPPQLHMYRTDASNLLGTPLYTTGSNPQIQTGDLYIDKLYSENTRYTYDISAFITDLINEGQFSTAALLLSPAYAEYASGIQRLIVNNQQTKNAVQLKLYVLGL